jgi:hypothetical protein
VARVHCPDCDMAVVIDPNGVCPEGHLIGNAGRRIELAIGDHTPHPDEPEPWSAVVDAPEAIEPDAEPDAPRAIRPISIAGEDDEVDEEQENEDLMRELHALSDLDVRTEERAATGPSAFEASLSDAAAEDDEPEVYRAPVAEGPTDTPAPPPAAERPKPKRSDEDLEAIAELAALFDGGTGGSGPSETPTPPPAAIDDVGDDEAAATESTEDHLASVSHLPYATAGQGGGAPASPERDTRRASGEAFDWSHFTAKGKRRRFGR